MSTVRVIWGALFGLLMLLQSLEIARAEGEEPQLNCSPVRFADHHDNKWPDEPVSATFLPYALASASAYYSDDDIAALAESDRNEALNRRAVYALERADSTWRLVAYDTKDPSGLGLVYYFKEATERLDVIIAFRGTRSWRNLQDWAANTSWVTRWFKTHDQYTAARRKFEEIRRVAIETSKGRKISFLATGHSLGGGLAQHVGKAFPCVTVVGFDASFVTNENFLAKTHVGQVIHIHDKSDLLGTVAKWAGNITKSDHSDHYQRYALPMIKGIDPLAAHKIELFSSSMARMTICCYKHGELRGDCQKRYVTDALVEVSKVAFCQGPRRGDPRYKARFDDGEACDFSSPKWKTDC